MGKPNLFIHPLDLGTLSSIDKSIFTLRHNQGTTLDSPCLAWVILGGEQNVLVDTGPCDPDWAARYHRPIKRGPSQTIPSALGGLGLKPDDIQVVIFTHLHWDHSYNLDYFPNATFFVQDTELRYAVNPLPMDRKPYGVGVADLTPPWMNVFGRIKPLDGDTDILPGIRVMHLPGHTPGSQGVVVETQEGQWVIAGDTVPLYDNLTKNENESYSPGGVYQDLYKFYESLKKLEPFDGKILPGHDEKVLLQPKYPVSEA